MNSSPQKSTAINQATEQALLQKIAVLEKQLAHQELRAEVLDTLINVAEKQLNISIRKKSGTQQSKSKKGKNKLQPAKYLPAVGVFCTGLS